MEVTPMDPTVLAVASFALSVIAVLLAVAALLRTGSIAKTTVGLSTPASTHDNGSEVRRDLMARIGEIDEQFNAMARQFDALQLAMSQLDLVECDAITVPVTAPAAQPLSSFEPVSMFEPLAAPETDSVTPPISPTAIVPERAPAGALPAAETERLPHVRVDELVAGYRAKIAERSKAPIREWLSQNNSFTLDAAEDGSLIPSESGMIAAIPIGDGTALLVPTASFVVDFATRFAGSQISLRQVMRNTFEAVHDNSGDMKLQAPAIARREGGRWIVEKSGRLGGFTDS
jgi:hypothetical protein